MLERSGRADGLGFVGGAVCSFFFYFGSGVRRRACVGGADELQKAVLFRRFAAEWRGRGGGSK